MIPSPGTTLSQYPPAHSSTYVLATSKFSVNAWPYYATDPAKSLTGAYQGNAWLSANGSNTDQCFHIAFSAPTIITRLYLENFHTAGVTTSAGVKNFTLWGSNSSTAFADLAYANDTDWIQLTIASSQWAIHAATDAAAPQYILVTNNTGYLYYRLKFSNNWGNGSYMGFRRLVLQGDDYLNEEAKLIGATPAVRATFLPYYWPDGIDGDGVFVYCDYVSPDRIEAEYEGFIEGSWVSEVITSNLQLATSPAVISWDWNYPGFVVVVYYRGAANITDLAAAAWSEVDNGDTIQIYPYYQIKITFDGYRCWAEEASTGDRDLNLFLLAEQINDYELTIADWDFEQEFDINQFYELVNSVKDILTEDAEFDIEQFVELVNAITTDADADWSLEIFRWDFDLVNLGDDFTAWAVDFTPDDYQSYAADTNVAGDNRCYVENMEILGEFTVINDIEAAGSLTVEAPAAFDDLVAGSHSGLLLSNRQGTVSTPGGIITWSPAPLYSPNKSTFLFQEDNWYGKQLKMKLGWLKSAGVWTEFITLFLGKITKWGPITRSVDEQGQFAPNTCEIYAKDFIADCLQKRIALPASDGTPQPLTYGEFLCMAETVSGWSPAPILKSAYFESPNYNELDHVISLGGGAFSLITPGLTGSRAFRTSVTGANQSAYGSIILPYSSEMFVTGNLRFTAMPGTIGNVNMTFLEIIDSSGAADYAISIDDTGAVYGSLGNQGDFNILGYEDVPIRFALWLSPTNPGYAKLWMNGDEVLTYTGNLSGDSPIEFRFGTDTAGVAETWTIDFDDIEVRTKYYKDAFRVTGAPFTDIGPVYIDNILQPASKTVGAYTQTLTRYPEYGLVQFESSDPEFEISGEVLIRVIETAGGRHPLYVLTTLLGLAGLTSYIDATALAAAYVAVPADICGARFEGGADKQDIASLGITIADCIKEICSRYLYWIFIDGETIKIIPYTGIAPSGPEIAFTAANLYEADQQIDMDTLNAFVSANYGWYARNPSLSYVAGDTTAGGQGSGLDFTWDGPVACESYDVVKAKADLLLKFLSAQERLEPIRTSLAGARLELMDVVSVNDTLLHDSAVNYLISRKSVNLDKPFGTELQALRFLGE